MVLDVNLGLQRRLIRGTNTRELLNHTLPSLLVQSLGITLLRHLNRHINIHLDERQTSLLSGRGHLVQLSSGVAVLAVGGDEGSNGDGGGISEQLGHFGNAADVLVAVGFAEAKVLVESEADVVTVQTVGVHAAVAEELVLEFNGQCGLARGGETRQPDCETALGAQVAALGAGEGAGVVGDVAGVFC